jgi:hypothetical protein
MNTSIDSILDKVDALLDYCSASFFYEYNVTPSSNYVYDKHARTVHSCQLQGEANLHYNNRIAVKKLVNMSENVAEELLDSVKKFTYLEYLDRQATQECKLVISKILDGSIK